MIAAKLRARLEWAADLCGRGYVRLVRAVRGRKPVAVEHWRSVAALLNWLFRTHNSMHSKTWLIAPAAHVRSRDVRRVLGNCEVGGWALDAATLDLLWAVLGQHRPETLLEFGSGLSTVVLAEYCRLHGGARPLVWSVEQDPLVLERARGRLASAGLERYVRLVHAPVVADGLYQIDGELARGLEGRRVDFVLIDGPSGRPGCREEVLRQAALYCRPGAIWCLDDAFRDPELNILRAWKRMPGVKVAGIYPVGKGFGMGMVEPPASA